MSFPKPHTEMIIDFLESHGGEATLGELLEAGRYSFAHKLTARLSELRQKGYAITCTKGSIPTQNKYRLEKPELRFQFDQDGQGVFA